MSHAECGGARLRSAPPERPWDPSASVQLRSCTRVGSPRIKRRSVTPNRANKWQMLWNSLSSVTTEGLKEPRDCFHMKKAIPTEPWETAACSADGIELGCFGLCTYTQQNTNRHTKAGFEQFICPAHGLTEPALEIKSSLSDWGHFLRCWKKLLNCVFLLYVPFKLIKTKPRFVVSFSVFWYLHCFSLLSNCIENFKPVTNGN